jgi:DNA repair exonuclease SbcCD ATPase subunit
VVGTPGEGDRFPETTSADGREELRGLAEPSGTRVSSEREELLAQVRRLEVELERYREHARRTSKLFLSASNYAGWVRENARRDAEVALRKARAKVDKLEHQARELERTEHELASRRDELARLQDLTDETRTRLSAFLKAELQVLDSELAVGRDDNPTPRDDLQGTLQERLPSATVTAPAELAEVEGPEP